MQALKYNKYAVKIRRLNTNSVIRYAKLPKVFIFFAPDVNLKRTLTSVLDGVADEVLKNLPQLLAIAKHGGQRVAGDLSSNFS